MNIKILTQNIVNNPSDFTTEQIEKYFEDYAELRLSAVMQRSEQLFAFLEYCDNAGWIKNVDMKRIIQDYEKSNNCA
jgi:tyrosyl-tRNA synthetase